MESHGIILSKLESEPSTPVSRVDAVEALRQMQAARRRVGDYALPTSYHLAAGGVFGTLLAAQGLPVPWQLAVQVAVIVAIAVMVRWSRRVTGRFVNGWRAGPTRWISAALLVIFLGLAIGTVEPGAAEGVRIAPFVAGLAMFVIAAAANWLWVLVYRAELRR